MVEEGWGGGYVDGAGGGIAVGGDRGCGRDWRDLDV